MRIGDVPLRELTELLREPGLEIDVGLVRIRIRSRLRESAATLQRVYGRFPLDRTSAFCDIDVALAPPPGIRAAVRPQVLLMVDGHQPFEPYPAANDFPLLEWGLNWYTAHRSNHVLLLHAGVVERRGHAFILPALPGSGKSTLTAALSLSGWRFLADEFGAVRLADGCMLPVVRPTGLKNESIEVIRAYSEAAVLGPAFHGTHKGTVAHLAPDAEAVDARHRPATPLAIVFPKYVTGADTVLEEMAGGRAFTKLAANSFNYELLGPQSFAAMGRLMQRTRSFRLTYSRLEEAVTLLGELHDELAPMCEIVPGPRAIAQ